MAQNGYGPTPAGHIGRIPNYGKTQINPMGNVEPPACIQNAMMTKDKKPFTYTPGGLDLSQIRTPSMARRLARQRSNEESDAAHISPPIKNGNTNHGCPAPPPPPPPPPLVIEAPNNKAPKPIVSGERPEIVIPDNPIGMLRKTNSPYHWETEQAEAQRMGPVPKFVEKVPSPLTVKLPQQNYAPPPNNYSRQNNLTNQYSSPDSPLHRPEAQYGNQQSMSPGLNGSPQIREILQRQDSQYNKSPQPFPNQSPLNNSAPYSPTANNHWRQPEKRDSPAKSSPQSPLINSNIVSPNMQSNSPFYSQGSPNNNTFHTLPRVGQRNQDQMSNANIHNSYAKPNMNIDSENIPIQNTNVSPVISNTAPWRTSTLNRYPRETQQSSPNQKADQSQIYKPTWKANDINNNPSQNNNTPCTRDSKHTNQQQYNPPWVNREESSKSQDNTAPWRTQERERSVPTSPPERYQSTISIPISPKKQSAQPDYNNSPNQREVVYVNQEPVYYCPESPNAIPPWVKTQKEKTKTPPPVWCQRPLDGNKVSPRELETPPRDVNQEPEWVRKSNELQKGARDVISPPKYQQSAQPNWSTRPSENRKSIPRDSQPQQTQQQPSRIIPIQMEVSSQETRNQKQPGNQNQPNLRIVIDMKQNQGAQNETNSTAPFSQPTQRIMRVLSPQLVKLDEGADRDLPTLNRRFQDQDSQPKTRIIPIQIEGNGGSNKREYYHRIVLDPPRQSNAFKVLQVITGTHGSDDVQFLENRNGFSDL
ncbi:unnamed protein product [Leptidea sinapis]|uniref:Uncharacterized protein n=2 Tax=Leptidea sinapis TaxID=189913 RepID=A0A5E4R7L2_9NEOP|nr:unnamed protein product [Leptidea sinapis]